MMLAAARKHEECSELEDLFIFGPTPRLGANWGFGVAGKENKVSVACYTRLDQIASNLQEKYELPPVKLTRRDIEARVWSLVHDHHVPAAPTKSPSSKNSRVGRIRQWNGVLTINWPKLPSNGSFGLFKRKLSWTKPALSAQVSTFVQSDSRTRASLRQLIWPFTVVIRLLRRVSAA